MNHIPLIPLAAVLLLAAQASLVSQQPVAITPDQLVGLWKTENADQPFDENDPSLTLSYTADGAVIFDEGTPREGRARWQLNGSTIVNTVPTNNNYRFVDRIIRFDAAQQTLVIESEPYNNRRFYLQREGADTPQNEQPFTRLICDIGSREGQPTAILFYRIASLPEKVFCYQVEIDRGAPELFQITRYHVYDDSSSRSIARNPGNVEELMNAFDNKKPITEFPNHWDNLGLQGLDRANAFFAAMPTILPKFKEWSEKAKELKPEPFQKRMSGQPGEASLVGGGKRSKGYAFDFIWNPADGPTLSAFLSVSAFGSPSGETKLDEEEAHDLEVALSYKSQVLADFKKILSERENKASEQQRLIEENFTTGAPAAADRSSTAAPKLAGTIKYRARIGIHDLQNSKGVFLPDVQGIKARDILLQDRFNYHQAGLRDAEDTSEGLYEQGKEVMRKFFESKTARLPNGQDAMPLLASQAVVEVTVTDSDIIVTPATD